MEELNKELAGKLEKFISKYYKNKIIRGLLIITGFSVLLLLIFVLAEYFYYFNKQIRTIVFYFFFTSVITVFLIYILVPVLKLSRIIKGIDYYDANNLLTKEIPEVKDRIINSLHLHQLSNEEKFDRDVIKHAINQKIQQIKPVNFNSIIKYRSTFSKSKLLLPLVLVLTGLLLVVPEIITGPVNRYVQHSREFHKPVPFTLHILNDSMKAVQGEDFKIDIKADGEEIPGEITLDIVNGNKIKLTEKNKRYSYLFRNIQEEKQFKLKVDEIISELYTLTVFPRPVILEFEANIWAPEHTGINNTRIQNNGNLIVPEGSEIQWNFYTRDADILYFYYSEAIEKLKDSNSNVFRKREQVFEDLEYSVVAKNMYHRIKDSIGYNIQVIPDQFPEIAVRRVSDTSHYKFEYFTGEISDDYGFSNLELKGEIRNELDAETMRTVDYQIDISDKSNIATFYYTLRLDSLDIAENELMIAWFEVTDNDEINNFKMSKSKKFVIEKRNEDEIEKHRKENLEKTVSSMEKGINEIKKLNDDIEKEIERLVQKEHLDWNDKQRIKELMKKQEQMMEKIEEEKKSVQKNLDPVTEDQKVDNKLLEKQKTLEKLFEEVIDEETKKLLEEINRLLEQFEKDKIREKLDQMQFNNQEVEEQLDRNIELLKQLQLEKQLSEVLEKLDKTIEKQEELKENTDKKSSSSDKLSEKQQELREEFDEVKEDIKEIESKNKQLESSYDMPALEQEKNKVSEEMQNSQEMLNKGKYKKAVESQKKSGEGLKNMREQIFQFMQQMTTQQLGEDINMIREILENIIRISFEQEELMLGLEKIDEDNPEYPQIGIQQKKISDDLKKVKDSLFALSKRQISIESVVNKQIRKIDDNIERAIDQIEAKRIRSGTLRQQNIVTALNDLGLLIAEALKNMENNMAMQNQMQGQGNCSKPGGGKSKSLSELQKQLNQQLEQLKNEMGKSKGQQKDGRGMSEKMAKMAAQQEMIRKALQKYMEENASYGIDKNGLNEALKAMGETEEDIINKIITRETIERQKKILTRLLESEKALNEREKEHRRESNEAKNYKISNPEQKMQYKEIIEFGGKSDDLTKELELRRFYRKKVKEYQNKLIKK